MATAIVLLALQLAAGPAGADTVASLLGNFTVNQYVGLHLQDDGTEVRYAVVFGQLPALRELHAADADGNGVTSDAEREAHAGRLARAAAEAIHLKLDGQRVVLQPVEWRATLPTESGGFSLRVDVRLRGALEIPADRATHQVTLDNGNFPGRFGWQEIVVVPSPSLAVFETGAFSTSATAALTETVQSLPADGPLSERETAMRVVRGAPPSGAHVIGPRLVTASMSAAAAPAIDSPSALAPASLAGRTRELVDAISGTQVSAGVLALALLTAMLLGALHAFAPGHGKSVVGAYLIGSRGTARHALFLGLTVTVTHTLGVFALGFATLLASRYVVPERLLPVLSLVSAALVLGMGLVLLRSRWASLRPASASRSQGIAWRPVGPPVRRYPTPAFAVSHARSLSHAIASGTGSFAHAHAHGGIVHSHGGVPHSHAMPGANGEAVSWRSLLALGISGGLVPCPSAMVLLLAAVALNRTAYGLVLVLAFSVGLAATLTAIGLIFLRARQWLGRFGGRGGARLERWLPIGSAALVVMIGVAMCCAAIVGTST